ncbi:glycine betaine/L-proline ABC transporter substrate-binding protein ProX [Ottowia caeni]|uniref:glycine betaine/L-proline ABC transporter substrate-binding protein ProX n=1 Tax=Ottowia caeni TaxID=2870339 RepID=UPI001E2A315E|nr:glycine betaine/L-proline ABC transporter substrate-binding protein ProX [Ottowia caeni]
MRQPVSTPFAFLRRTGLTLLSAGLLALSPAAFAADDPQLPGKGVRVLPLKSSIAEETFQTVLVMKALERLGYDVQPIREVEYPTAHLAIASGDATFLADHWDPMHSDFYKNSGGDAKLWRDNTYIANNIHGYVIDKRTADEHNITNMSQLADPAIAKLFDSDGDGRANLTGCTPGWACETLIEAQLTAYKLRDTVQHQQGSYPALMADVISRYKAGRPILYYTWTPYWVSNVLVPGKDVVWLEVPFSAEPGGQGGQNKDTTLPNGRNYGTTINNQRILANRAFIEAHPDAAKLFSLMKLPVTDVTAQNNAMNDGEASQSDIERHAEGWIKAHQTLFNSWLDEARAAVKR